MTYDSIQRAKKETKVIILSNKDNTERFLFFKDPFSMRHNPMIRRQLKVNGIWRNMEGLEGNEFAVQLGGIVTNKERGNLRYLELQDKGFNVRTETTLAEV